MKNFTFAIFGLLLIGTNYASAQTVGLKQKTDSSLDNGYILFAPIASKSTFLIDKCGKLMKTWTSTFNPGLSVYLLNDGNLLRTGKANNTIFVAGGNGGIIEKIDWSNNVIWSYKISDSFKCQHHDIKALPNGNVLVIAWESKTNLEAIDLGRDPGRVPPTLWSEQILEIKPIGKDSGIVVWEWHLWDHLVQDFDPTKANFGAIATNPQLLDINYAASPGLSDWIHINAIDYNEDLDQILLCAHNTDEIWIIDHSVTKAQAATHLGGKGGKGGDILYRWGNPKVYGNGVDTNQKFFGQHNAVWIEKGLPFANQIMVYNNGGGRPVSTPYTTVQIINPPLSGFTYTSSLPYGPKGFSWEYNKDGIYPYYAQNISGAQQLSNGNVLLCNGPFGQFTEVTSAGNTVWEYINPVYGSGIFKQGESPIQNQAFRCSFYPKDFAGFKGHTLKASLIIEDINPISAICTLNTVVTSVEERMSQNDLLLYPNPSKTQINIIMNQLHVENASVAIFNSFGQRVFTQQYVLLKDELHIPIDNLPSGHYYIKIIADTFNYAQAFIKEN